MIAKPSFTGILLLQVSVFVSVVVFYYTWNMGYSIYKLELVIENSIYLNISLRFVDRNLFREDRVYSIFFGFCLEIIITIRNVVAIVSISIFYRAIEEENEKKRSRLVKN